MQSCINNLIEHGAHLFGEILEPEPVKALYRDMVAARAFDASLFMSEAEYLAQENHFNANPTPAFNFLNAFEDQLRFIEQDPRLQTPLQELLGEDYDIIIKKAVCGVPDAWLPGWVRERIRDVNVANLGPYIKKPFRDITYFRGIDFHQDIIDWPQGRVEQDPSTFLTLYVYLHEVGEHDSPLHLIPGSHRFGATLFPHRLEAVGHGRWRYTDDHGNQMQCEDQKLLGGPGYVGLWHNCTLHGTRPVTHESEQFRLSLRYLLGRSKNHRGTSAIDGVNRTLRGQLEPQVTRRDLNDKGIARIRGNIINSEK
ncbi:MULTISPECIES: phytanoyl-CoA dioxygenase family protein [unclassified Pseudomonas]|uniref:phytanoyl-CoA dioxygenase family protein n=1 Tax=unclassified Pseudomonas TaxID=196821 RepID=UPI000BCAF558|nr:MULTISPECIES: phytanoyl-CoA dioxygenase family protein [unclassified Pseudomonas]PVZ16444.1 phytanoyl-CoA dioxygenase PhyH [Pseudomonas sp. URIL14HWK12:I12]PVZ25700.1 phytanoyl-CoA dioxygenase PhyH [Pseudomonas sp. URIL14HWK12:I10]PVZ36776.1 phytanoyl-CoA dioxygenase PhyH [Pseudomonas sp. URIL14HWK12:I11]SNZ12636.1 Phytanoyl-CoA dioxygenase (PhyH) [Pseudomonas sp. URIL14HWK12:I9]